ncbi:GNAT family N-acetyltransferase [Nisaea sp.]|uniref:GNAT family N-acetyltransferase n=1 Tax=Nisaea sp. TaxID=2024842 RepID=UPI003B5234BF
MSGLDIRRATTADIPRVAGIYRDARLHAYHGLVPDPDIIASAAPDRPKWRELLADPAVSVFVAERDGAIVAMAIMEGVKLESLHVDPAAHGSGIGQRFLAFCRQQAGPGMELYCLAGNHRAIEFYCKAGMRQAGDVDQLIFGKIYPAHRFVYED